MALYSGMRLSEILGLQWDHVNLETGDILIDRQLAMLRKKGETRRLTPTKTRNTRRITAPPSLCKMLLDQKNQQEEWKRKARASWNNDLGLVFTTETGESVPHASVEHQFTVVAKRAGLDNHVFHDLRHTFAVNALRAGIDIETISKLLGHFDPGFTLRVYADMTSDMRQSAAEKLQAMMEEREHPTQTPETSQPSEEGQIKNLLDSLV